MLRALLVIVGIISALIAYAIHMEQAGAVTGLVVALGVAVTKLCDVIVTHFKAGQP